MLARIAAQRSSAITAVARAAPALSRVGGLQVTQQEQLRHAATLKQLSLRMKSIANMKKITKAMKMVATAKFKKDLAALENGMPFGKPVINLFERLGDQSDKAGNVTYLAVTSDKGLCGGVNTFVCKNVKLSMIEEEAKGNTAKIMFMGSKGGTSMKRLYGDRFTHSFEDLGKMPWNITTAYLIGDRLIASNAGRVVLVHNHFKNMAAYETMKKYLVTPKNVKDMDTIEFSKAMDSYNFEPGMAESWQDIHQFYYGACIYVAFLDSAKTETAQRMSSMENASKNAGEMYHKVALQFNRARQAKITTELCEIISGASAV